MTLSPTDQAPSVPASDFRTRIISGAALAVVALVGVAIAGWVFAIGLVVVTTLIAWEWATMTVGRDSLVTAAVAVPGIVAVLLAAAGQPLAAILIVALSAVGVAVWFRSPWAAGGVVYAAVLGLSLVLLRIDPFHGLAAILFVFAIVWGSDTGAYFAGRTFGGPKLWPRVSPKKTWSGLAGGTVAGVVAGILVAVIAGTGISVMLIVVAVVLSLLSAAGDLFESAVKRRFGVKDASNLIPGHGGVMDRVDGLLVAAGAAALIGSLHAGWPLLGTGLLSW